MLRIRTMNILADGLSALRPDKGGFVYISPADLDWMSRFPVIMSTITNNDPDVICLQELDHYNHVKDALGSEFSSIFAPKPKSPCLEFSTEADGVAIFYKANKFEIKHQIIYNYRSVDKAKGNENQVAIICILNVIEKGYNVCISTTHLKAEKSEEGEIVRADEIKQLILQVEAVISKYDIKGAVICGDMNSDPTQSVYEIMTSSTSSFLEFKSSYNEVNGKEPPFTSWKFRPKGEAKYTIDFIYFASKLSGLKPIECLIPPDESEIGKEGLPTVKFPSDHLPLMTTFLLE